MTLLSIFLVILMVLGIFLIMYGFQKYSQLSVLFGSAIVLAAGFYLVGWSMFIPLAPIVAFLLSLLVKG